MAGPLQHSPSDVISRLLVALGLASDPSADPLLAWPAYVEVEPSLPDDCITVQGTQGQDDGKTMADSERCEHHGIQVRVRSRTQPTGYVRARAIRVAFDSVRNRAIAVDTNVYLIKAISRTSDVIEFGKNQPGSERSLFSLNAYVALRQTQ